MTERALDDPELPPPGRRSGAGSASILPYLLRSLATRPTVPAVALPSSTVRHGGSAPPGRPRKSKHS